MPEVNVVKIRRPGRIGLALLLAWLVAASAEAPEPWISPGDVDLATFLPPPPAADSTAQRADLDAVLAVQTARTEAQVQEARADQLVSVFRFADVLGSAFSPTRTPRAGALAQEACRQSAPITAAAKRHWNRPRPFKASNKVTPVITNATEGSYPSGHATCGYLWAILLADMVPEKRAELFERGIRYGTNRVIGGVHYPSDVEAGRMGAVVIAAALFADPRFRLEHEAAKTELRSVMGVTSAPAGS